MAGKGTYTAYQRLRPIDTNFGDVAEGFEARLKRQRAKDEAREQERKKKRDDISNKFAADYESLQAEVIGVQSLDEAAYKGVADARDMMAAEATKALNNLSYGDSMEYKMKMANLRKFPSNIANLYKRYEDFAAQIRKAAEDGSLSGWNDDSLAELSSIFENANLKMTADQKGQLMVMTIGANGELKEIDALKILNGSGMDEVVTRVKAPKLAQEIGKGLAEKLVEGTEGFDQISQISWNMVEEGAGVAVDSYLGTVEEPSPTAKSIWTDTLGGKKSDWDADAMEEVREAMMVMVENTYKTKESRKTNLSARNAAIKEANRKREKSEETQSSGVALKVGSDGKPLREGLVGVSGDLGGAAYSFSLKEPVSMNLDGVEVEFQDLALTDSGKITFAGAFKQGKSSGELEYTMPNGQTVVLNKTVVEQALGGGLNEDVLQKVARAIPGEDLRDANDLKKHLEEVKNQRLKELEAEQGDSGELDDL